MPQWAVPFAAHCRARLKQNDAVALPARASQAPLRLWNALAAHRTPAAWHVACWVHRPQRGNA